MPLTDSPVKGMYIVEDGKYFFLQDRQLKTQGRQGGLIIMRLKALDDGRIFNKTIKSGTKVEYITPQTKEVQYLYSDDSNSYFMDMQTFESLSIAREVIGEYIHYLKEGESILILTHEGKVLSIKENPTVILEVVEAEDAVRGNTANAATKLVTVETGYKLQVPLFIKKGDKIKINTESGTYSAKAN